MAADIHPHVLDCSQRQTKLKKLEIQPKLLVGHEVEVRSVDEGFLGSWHAGKVIASEYGARRVQYQHLLCDDGSNRLIDSVSVNSAVDGVVTGNGVTFDQRGMIRPMPPKLEFGTWCLHYGQCVDLLHNDAWWEGVIFDRADGSMERMIFFPDMGDEMKGEIEKLRITQEWDEITGHWKPRGDWLFLQLIEELEQDWPLCVSVKQIWYEMRLKNGFGNIREWTSTLRNVWKDLLLRVILDNFKLTLNEVFHRFNFSGHLEKDQIVELSDHGLDAILKANVCYENSLAVVPSEITCNFVRDGLLPADQRSNSIQPAGEESFKDDLASVMDDDGLCMDLLTSSSMPGEEGLLCIPPATSPILPCSPVGYCRIGSNDKSKRFSRNKVSKLLKPSAKKKRHDWQPIGVEAEFCPDVIFRYDKRPSYNNKLASKVRKHLPCLGWNIMFTKNDDQSRYCYISPEGKRYNSLCEVCRVLRESPCTNETGASDVPDGFYSPLFIEPPKVSNDAQEFNEEVVTIVREYCPQAVLDYCYSNYDREKRDEIKYNAKKHLSYLGWSFYFTRKGERRELRYLSPHKKIFYSLIQACKFCLEQGFNGVITSGSNQDVSTNTKVGGQVPTESLSSPLMDMEFRRSFVLRDASAENQIASPFGVSPLRKLVEQGKVPRPAVRKLPKKRKSGVGHVAAHLPSPAAEKNVGLPPSRKRRKHSKALIKTGDDVVSEIKTHVLRSSKRARQASSHQTPRTILSWLIENNVVLPRAKVSYCAKSGHTMGEGRITREGIKCSCCQKVFSLSSFEAHVGSSNHRPSAHIILEDGRSLLDCQLQLKNKNNLRGAKSEALMIKANRQKSKNDYICSVCHYGGELVLCDQCPSSFHTNCLGLNEVPDGDWFCPSCCCKICGQSRFSKHTEQSRDDNVLCCEQCERQFHMGCLRHKGGINLDSYPEGLWFCNERCKRIFFGLHRLLGKPVPVGTDNLTWTLLKYMESDNCDYDDSVSQVLTESYSKLNVALGVMHECFEPVKEPRTRRDLVEDVMLNRRSELNRLNFRGFYTVLLERNDELITVATVRVYGEKVAEIPLVGTRFQYRRMGMCRILMKELEKKLMELGVERLVLPAVPSVLDTWTTSFGFSVMTNSERLNLLDYTFLDFQGTVMCQKPLIGILSEELSLSRGTQEKHLNPIIENESGDLEGSSAVSEVFQADKIDDSEMVDHGLINVAGGDGGSNSSSSSSSNSSIETGSLVTMVSKPTQLKSLHCQTEPKSSIQVAHRDGENIVNGGLICYKRRKISVCGS